MKRNMHCDQILLKLVSVHNNCMDFNGGARITPLHLNAATVPPLVAVGGQQTQHLVMALPSPLKDYHLWSQVWQLF